jgi:hypothetical protein
VAEAAGDRLEASSRVVVLLGAGPYDLGKPSEMQVPRLVGALASLVGY